MGNQFSTLTTSADSGSAFVGGAGNDTFNATIGTNGTTANGTTFNPGDNLNGGTGTNDSLVLSIAGTNTAAITTASVTLAGIENIAVSNFQTDDAQDNTINLSTATGVSKISLTSSAASGDTFFTAVRSLVTGEMGNGAGDLGITYADTAVAGTSDVQTLNLAGQTGGTFTVAPTATGVVETISIASGTSANTVAVTSAGTTTINASGDQNLSLTEGMTDTITRVNASAMTGKFAFTTNDATVISVTGGSADDTITLGATFASTDSIDGGAGNDNLSVAVAVTQATLANVSNVETLTVTGGNSVTLAANVGPTTFTVSDATASVVTLNTGYTNATTVNLGVTDSVVNSANVALTAAVTAANAISGAGISITGGSGVDALNITATSSAAFTLANVTLLDSIKVIDAGDTVALAGADISITVGAAYATALTVDASGLDAGTLTGTTMNADFENLNFDASMQSTAATVLNVTGGAGADTITGGAGNDIITGGAGNDSINGAAGGNDSISGGDGVDTINMGAALTSADTIDGGAGNDTLTVTSLTGTGLTNVTNVETLSLSGAASTASLSANLSFTTVDMDTVDNTAQTLTLAAGYTNATTVLVDAGDRVTNTANAVLTVNVNAANIATASGTVITGGSANDTLNIKADTNAGAATTLAGLVTLVDRITVVDGGDTVALAGSDLSITTGAYATSLTIDGSQLDVGTLTGTTPNNDYENLTVDGSGIATATVVLNVTGGGGRDTITGGAGNDIISTGGENDSINGGSGGNDSISGGDGVDTINMAGALTYQDTIDGGAGTDVLRVNGAIADVDFTKVTLVETLTMDANVTATLGSIAQAAGIVTVNAFTTSTAAISAATYTTAIRINASATDNAEAFTGGSGDDTFGFATTATLTANDVIAGGTGNDTILVGNAAAAVAVTGTVDFDNATSIEKITLGSASGAAAASAETITLTVDTLTLATAQTVTIDASVITDSNDTVTITNNAASTTTKFNILGGAGADVLAGSSAADTIEGGLGADSITGNLGADVLTGGAGADVFNYALTDATQAAADRITDFATGSDRIFITAATVASGATVDYSYKGTAANNSDAMGLLSSKVGEYYFNTTSGTMVLDTDGNGLLQSGDFAVTLTSMTTIGALDVQVTITDASGAEKITTGSGNDTINMTNVTANKADSVNAGAGDDTINTVQDSLNDTTSDTIVGGAGNDTLNIGGTAGAIAAFGSDAALATVENININTTGSTLDLSAQTEAFNVTMVSTGLTAGVTLNTGAHTVTGGTGTDTVTVSTRAILLSAASINGGAGTDSIVVGTASTAFVDSDFTKIASVESLTLTGASSIVLGANATAAGIGTIVTGNDTTSITSTQAALAVTGTSLATTKVLTLLGSANYTVTSGGTAHDRITATGSTGTLSATFGDANSNGITVAAGNGNTTIVGGGAADTITVTGLATAAQTFTGSVSKFAITAGVGAQTITTGTAVDTITGGEGADVINVGSGNADTVVFAAASLAGLAAGAASTAVADSITGTTLGATGAGGDVFNISITNGQTGLLIANANNGAVAAGASTVEVIAALTATTLGATTNVIVMTTTYASSTALLAAIGTGAARLTQATQLTANSDMVIVWSNGVDSYIGLLNDSNADGAAVMATADLTYSNLATLVGITTAAGGANANFAFIA